MFTQIGHFGTVVSRYDPENIPKLEAHVDKQLLHRADAASTSQTQPVQQQEQQQGNEPQPASGGGAIEFDQEANLALLKLYQFFPEQMNLGYLCKVLVLGLMHIATTPLSVYLSLIPDRLHSRPDVTALIGLCALLETAQFSKFWEEIRKPEVQPIVSVAQDFEATIRQFIIGVLVITYRRIDIPSFCGYLQIDQSEVSRFVEANRWTTDGSFISFPVNEFTQPRPRKANELNFQEVVRVLNA